MYGGGYRYGNQQVHYTGDGRVNSDPRDMTFPRNHGGRGAPYVDDYRSYDRDREMRRDRRPMYPTNPPPSQPPGPRYYTGDNRRPDYDGRYTNTGYQKGPDSPKYFTRKVERKELIEDEKVRRMAGYSPWGVIFIITGALLILIGVPNAILCYDAHYYFRFWAGFLVVLMGVFGVWHQADYLSTTKNWCYIISGLLSHTALMVGCGLMCWSFIPTALMMIQNADNIASYISYVESTGVSGTINITTEQMVWTCLGLDCSTYAIVWANFLTLNGVVIMSHNYWDANHKWTGKFEPLTRPFLFNPAGQMGVGQAMCFMGFLTGFLAWTNNVLGNNYGRFWSPLWAGVLVIMAGGVMCAACKRPDHGAMVGFALFLEVLAFLATGAATVLITMGIVYDSQKITEYQPLVAAQSPVHKQMTYLHITNLVVLCVTAFILCVSVLYGLWQIFRLVRFLATGNEHKHTPTISEDRSFSIYHRDHRPNDKYPYPATDKHPYPTHDRYTSKVRY